MNERIAKVRSDTRISQKEFAEELGLTRNFISLVECGKKKPSERTISDICRKFGVRKEWLKDGIGEPYDEMPKDEIATFIAGLLTDTDDEVCKLIQGVIKTYCDLDKTERKIIQIFLCEKSSGQLKD